jgi:hypothetical protein
LGAKLLLVYLAVNVEQQSLPLRETGVHGPDRVVVVVPGGLGVGALLSGLIDLTVDIQRGPGFSKIQIK